MKPVAEGETKRGNRPPPFPQPQSISTIGERDFIKAIDNIERVVDFTMALIIVLSVGSAPDRTAAVWTSYPPPRTSRHSRACRACRRPEGACYSFCSPGRAPAARKSLVSHSVIRVPKNGHLGDRQKKPPRATLREMDTRQDFRGAIYGCVWSA